MKTKIISVAGEKGGVGKTTLNIMLATNLFRTYGKKVVLLDVDDPQFSIFKKRQREMDRIGGNDGSRLPVYPIVKVTVKTIRETILEHYGKVDFIIIDFPGSLSLEMVQGLMFVEHIFIPFDYDELEIDSTFNFYRTLKHNFLDNGDRVLRSIHLFFNKYREVQRNKFADLKEQVKSSGLPFMDNVVKEKTIYREQYRSTLYPIPEPMETGPRDIKNFFREVMTLSCK
jgi:cellulose biosynthesis protein BcsQ